MGKGSHFFKHGHAIRNKNGTRDGIYLVWVNLRQRCNNKDNTDYALYGGRGISHCKRWDSYKNFFDDMGNDYYSHKKKNKYTTLDRINVNGNYCKKNCRWATRYEQSNNRNYNNKITFMGKSMTISQWIEKLGLKISWKQVNKRINRGWGSERSFNQPLRGRGEKVKYYIS